MIRETNRSRLVPPTAPNSIYKNPLLPYQPDINQLESGVSITPGERAATRPSTRSVFHECGAS